ncbi:MAG: hypothetical protein JWQ83_1312, partial [Lacunisphaera sp.]|nr:hypothetical protein [Lacunisphaera sp.]
MRRALIAWFLGAALLSAVAAETLQVSFDPARRELGIAAGTNFPAELRIDSPGLAQPEVGADVGEPGEIYLPSPPGETVPARLLAEAQNIYFFNPFLEAGGWELVLGFDPGAQGTWKLNGRFSPRGGGQHEEGVVPVSDLEQGENLLHLRGASLKSPVMYFRRRWPGGGERHEETLRTIPANWSGRVSLWRVATAGQPAALLAEQSVPAALLAQREVTVPDRWWEQREQVRAAALAVGGNLLSNQVRRPGSLFEGGFNLVYDPTHQAHRMAHWIWSWGPSIDFLFQLARLESSAARAAEFRQAAVGAARRSLAFELTQPGHPAKGLSTVRWEPSRATPQGWAEYLSTADSLFLAGWGWMAAYAETKEPVFLERTQSLVAVAERLMAQHPVVPQDWIVERARWTPHTLDESLFGLIGFRRLYEATGSPAVGAAGRRFLDSHLRHMGREGGLVARAWLHEENRDIWDPDIKGHAWVIEGYLDGFRFSHDEQYLAR